MSAAWFLRIFKGVYDMDDNTKAFLDTLAFSEGTWGHGDDGYNVICGGELFEGYADHPRVAVHLNATLTSTAAGRYQILSRYFDIYKKQLGLPDFSPASQDEIALQLIKECKATTDISNGLFDEAVYKCRSRWASLPGAGYGQHENKMPDLRAFYVERGGTISD